MDCRSSKVGHEKQKKREIESEKVVRKTKPDAQKNQELKKNTRQRKRMARQRKIKEAEGSRAKMEKRMKKA